MNEDMSNLINKFSSMLKNNEVPPELSNIMKNISNNNSDTSSNNNNKNSKDVRKDISSENKDYINNSNSTNSYNNMHNENSNNIKNNNDDGDNSGNFYDKHSRNRGDNSNSGNFDFSNIDINAIKKMLEQSNNSSSSKNSNDDTNSSFNFDINTMMKMKSIIEAMNSQKDDPRANLLKSLKPYLKESRKEKVDQYIKIFSMEKVFEQLNPLGGDKKL